MITDQSVTLLLAVLVLVLVAACVWLVRKWGAANREQKVLERTEARLREAIELQTRIAAIEEQARAHATTAANCETFRLRVEELEVED